MQHLSAYELLSSLFGFTFLWCPFGPLEMRPESQMLSPLKFACVCINV